ncbi:immunoglobulin-like domain-containing protein [Haploplasma axanthum]|uniref:Pesticidal crystal protein Cry22Aa Ig-like domain-containing protein n=1 Tax=Haploplasma axanthum TaxID=29552 RepID=A0A449BBW0_HAPAX|nr:immunoglobulin-like domain-containing protein [Haploplasma axanthum]VEU79765.1 Uncharacterised protein [Haploplasma axanthum]
MKKILLGLIVFILGIGLAACDKEVEPIVEDKIAPIIRIQSDYLIIYLEKNQDVNIDELLIQGVTAIDNIDGDITGNIQIDKSELDLTKTGTYTVKFYVFDKARNQSTILTKQVIVRDTYEVITPFPIWSNPIENEAAKPADQKVFGGAWYYKVTSAEDYWVGIEGTVILPELKIRRYEGAFDSSLNIDPNFRNLDNPSIYMGGHAATESDVGLSFKPAQVLVNGNERVTNGSFAFRPFWRYITTVEKDEGTYDLAKGRRYSVSATGSSKTNMIANWYFGDTQYYYLPGDKLRIIIYSPSVNYLQLQIEVIEKSKLESSIKIRKDNNWKDPESFVSPVFRSGGHGGTIKATYKRVNAIDQVANEGKTAIHTETEVKTAIWESVYLHRKINGKLYRVPFNENRASTIGAPDQTAYTFTAINPITGGQSVSIHPETAITRPKEN